MPKQPLRVPSPLPMPQPRPEFCGFREPDPGWGWGWVSAAEGIGHNASATIFNERLADEVTTLLVRYLIDPV